MIFSPVSFITGYHGHLTSNNCVIDARWVCKVTDHGFTYLKQSSGLNGKDMEDDLWAAPEILRQPPRIGRGSKEGDVYSFGIIVQELVTESQPFSGNDSGLDVDEIIKRVKAGESPPYRPVVKAGSVSLML